MEKRRSVYLIDNMESEQYLLMAESLQFLSVSTGIPPSLVSRLFYIHASLEVHRASEGLRFDIRTLETLFPSSVHLKAQHALCEYHMRGMQGL
jgi:hypothetical protein